MLTIHLHNTNELYMSKVNDSAKRHGYTISECHLCCYGDSYYGIFYSLNNVVWELWGSSSTVGTGC